MTVFKRDKAYRGGAGIDGQDVEEFESDLKENLYKSWNRTSSGSYFPPPVRLVEIQKKSGGKRGLGIPTVGDPSCPNGSEDILCAESGAHISRRLIYIPTKEISHRCNGTG